MSFVVPEASAAAATPKSPSTIPAAYRLLYRGALSLPDSHLLLDGLTFVARLDSPSKHGQLLQNPLALALESMRGRQSLRFMGIVKLYDGNIWWDESVAVELEVHPRATLTRTFFENVFCLTPFQSSSTPAASSSPEGSDIGVKVALGDSDGPETTQAMIVARPSIFEDHCGVRMLDLVVVRLTDRPRHQNSSLRLPRPDDPTPRKPPPSYGNGVKTKRELIRASSHVSVVSKQRLKRVASTTSDASSKRKKAVTDDGVTAAYLGSGVRIGSDSGATKDDALFKVPDLPRNGIPNPKGKDRQSGDDNVFGSADMFNELHINAASNGKQIHDPDQIDAQVQAGNIERANKDLIKRCTLKHLKDSVVFKIDKSNPEFKDLFGWVSRGVGFALRAQMRARSIDTNQVDQLIDMHVSMYLGGHGGITAPVTDSSRP